MDWTDVFFPVVIFGVIATVILFSIRDSNKRDACQSRCYPQIHVAYSPRCLCAKEVIEK